MMTKEEIASIVLYCKENNVSFKSRLEKLGITPWRFYDAKSRYAKNQTNELLDLGDNGSFIACPDLSRKSFPKSKAQTEVPGKVNIELQTACGTIMRIQGELDSSQLKSIILSVTGHV